MKPDDRKSDPFDAMEYAGALALAASLVMTIAVALWTAAQIYGCPL